MKRSLVFSAILILAFSSCCLAVKMNIDPPRVEVSVKPGQRQSGYITVLNYDQDRPIHVKAYINDLVYLPDGSNDFLPAGTTPWSLDGELKISPTEFDIAAGEETKVRYIAEVPRKMKGGSYGVVFFEVSPPLEELKGKTGAAINIRVGSIFLITAKGTEIYKAELQDLSVGKPDQEGMIKISCNVRNQGNILIRPNGTVKIIDLAKTEIAELKLNEEKSGVLPGTSREFSVQYDRGKIPAGKYFVQAVLDYGGEILLGGQTTFETGLAE
jgi:P pilus assembly chaperone PapD